MMNKKKLFKWLQIAIIVYCLIGITLYYLQEKILFHPKTLSSDHKFSFQLPFEEISIPFNSEDTMSMIKFFPKDSVRKGVVLYYHGNKDNVEHYAEYADNFTGNGYEVWMEDYPGYGKSRGERTEQKIYEQALQVRKMAGAKYGNDSIIIYGKSLGSGIASFVASRTANRKLILETPYYSVPDLFNSYTYIYPASYMSTYKFPTYKYLQDVTEPVTILQGTSDWIVPYRCAVKLKKVLKPGDEFIVLNGGSHNDLDSFKRFHVVLDSLLR